MVMREGLVRKERKSEVGQTLTKLFNDKKEAEFAFNIISKTFSILRIEKSNDMRFPINFRSNERISIGVHDKNRFVHILGFVKSQNPSESCNLEILLSPNNKGAEDKYVYFNFDKSTNEPDVRIYKMPLNIAMLSQEAILGNYEESLGKFGANYKNHQVKCSIRDEEVEQRVLREIFLNGFSNVKERDELFPILKEDLALKAQEYTLAQCAEHTGFDLVILERWSRAIKRKGQIILYGPPGTGKTYMAEQFADYLVSGSDGKVDIVQFHPAYAYEDFIQGIRPKARESGGLDYPIVPGRFLEFCKKAESCYGPCVLIIDEINRANLANVFGELMYLLEVPVFVRRDRKIPLADGGYFSIPNNLYIIGTMNTADRSIALVDHALRRRFAFIRLGPNYEILRKYHERKKTGFQVDNLIEILSQLNNQIGDQNYEIGISFFLRDKLSEEIEDIWRMEIEPYLEEYYFDHLENVEDFRWEKIRSKIAS